MIKKALLVLIFLGLIFCAVSYFWNTSLELAAYNSGILENPDSASSLRYRVYLLGVFPIGEALISDWGKTQYKGKQVYRLHAEAKTLDSISEFFNASVTIDSYVDTKYLSPILYREKMVVEGKKDVEKEVTYNLQEEVMVIAGEKRKILPSTQDPVSAMWNIRRMKFDEQKAIEMNINTNQKNYLLAGTTELKKISLKHKKRDFVLADCLIKRRGKSPYHKTALRLTMMKDKENLPILVRVFAGGILITAKLIEVK